MPNSDLFLQTFIDLEHWLRQRAEVGRGHAFSSVVDRLSRTDPAVRRYKDDLREFAELRNAIVHERGGGFVIAEPNDWVLERIESVRDALLAPPGLLPGFQVEVSRCAVHDPIGAAVTEMRDGDFSQLPVIDEGRTVALLTAKTICRWLGAESGNDLVSLLETRVEEVLEHREGGADEEHYRLLDRAASAQDALTVFEEFAGRGRDLDAILISHSGRAEEKLLGIVTIHDFPRILESLGLAPEGRD